MGLSWGTFTFHFHKMFAVRPYFLPKSVQLIILPASVAWLWWDHVYTKYNIGQLRVLTNTFLLGMYSIGLCWHHQYDPRLFLADSSWGWWLLSLASKYLNWSKGIDIINTYTISVCRSFCKKKDFLRSVKSLYHLWNCLKPILQDEIWGKSLTCL